MYCIQAVEQLEMLDCEDDAALDAFLSLARFADAQYQHIDNYMKSPNYEAKQALARQAKAEAEQLRRLGEQRLVSDVVCGLCTMEVTLRTF